MQKKIFWMAFTVLSIGTYWLPLLWGLVATLPIALLSWWIAYRSDWFE